MTILVVDDARVMRNIVTVSIKENYKGPIEFMEALDGASALKVVQNNKINMMCVDWNMPGLNGLELVKRVRKMENYKEVPIIMITSEAAKYMILEAAQAGVTDYLVKPIVGKVLWSKLKGHFQK